MPTKYRLSLLFAFAIGLCALLGTGKAQDAKKDVKDDVSVARMKKDIFFLASEDCEGRGVGTQGLDLAAEYIAAQFRKAGLKPGGVNGTYFQPFPFATGAVSLSLTGPGEIVGENPFALSGGAGAVWVKAKEAAGTIRLEARHQYLGKETVEIRVRAAEAEYI